MKRNALVLAAIVWIGFALLPLVVDDWQLLQLAQFMTYGVFAMSLALIWGQAGLLCFGQAIFFGGGAYAMSLVTMGLIPGLPASSWLGLIAAMVLPALFANLLGRFLFYGRGLRGAHFGIVTLAIAVIAERLAINWEFIGGFNGLMGVPPLNLGIGGDLIDGLPVYYAILAVAVIVFALLAAMLSTPFGLALNALRNHEDRAAFLGYDNARLKLAIFTIAAAVAGLSGALFVAQFAFASPTLLGFGLSTEVLIWTALGGKSLLIAAFLGAVVVRVAENFLSEILGPLWLLGLGALFVLCVIFFPRGLIAELLLRLERLLPGGRR
ncbi:MAG: branched-chain amino acid ABC transporter permease [Rhodospirillaceae bacterium]|nr:branched-chain amino acid ABC transporter permease [Rhodospirillaceae bacterium]